MKYPRPGAIVLVFLFISFINLCPFSGNAQAKITDTLESKIKNSLSGYYRSYPVEKLYIHTNQNIYISGQTLWYKLYATAYGKPSQLSKIVYVQLTDDKGNIIIQNKLPLNESRANGNIDLQKTLPTGWYHLSGFTTWLLNFDKAGFYHQEIYIQNPADAIQHYPTDKPGVKYHVDIFPEGGDLIDGNICNVAFKATDENGLPVKVYGEVMDNAKKAVAKLVTIHSGMGTFQFEPSASKNYTAFVHFPDNTSQTVALPAIKKTGLSLQVNAQTNTEIELRIAFAGKPEQYSNSVLTAFQNNGRITTYPLQLSRGINVFALKKGLFLTGTLRLTLFDQAGIPEAERLVFVNNNDGLRLDFGKDTLTNFPDSKSVFTLNVKDADSNPVHGNFSVAVIDADAFANDHWAEQINTSLLLTSELKGYIHEPNYYFANTSDSLQKQLDLVMLTNGWRHFKWEKVFDKQPVKLNYTMERPLFIAGKISGYNKSPLKIKLIIAHQDSSKYIGYITPDSTGSFIMNNYNHRGVSKIYYEAADAKNHRQQVNIQFMRSMTDTLKLPDDTIINFTENPLINPLLLANGINENKRFFGESGIVLKTVNVNSKKTTPTDKVIKNHVNNFQTDNAYTLDLVNNTYPDIGIINYIQGKFPGLQIYNSAKSTVFIYHGTNALAAATDSMGNVNSGYLPYFYLNESPTDLSEVSEIPLFDVALIRFMPPPVWFAPYNGGNIGAIAIYTKNQKDGVNTFKSKESFDHYTFNGYSITREFSSPDYSKGKTNFLPDNRVTLYWNHDLDTDTNGVVKFHFYNSDKSKKYRVIVQGMDANGRLGYLDEVF